ncbi:hypothetical protein IKG33_00925 [Candidatus Saccharibacteria bacterium]|nr:hypothetical protein [Candidatus Saccharibacteria bacterium]
MSHNNAPTIRNFIVQLLVAFITVLGSFVFIPTTVSAISFTKEETTFTVKNGQVKPTKNTVIDWSGIAGFIVIIVIGSLIFSKSKSSSSNKTNKKQLKTPSSASRPNKTNTPPNQKTSEQMPKTDTQKISAEVKKVINCIGISEQVDAEPIKKLLHEKKTKSAIMAIAEHLSLGNLNVSVIRKTTTKRDEKNLNHHTLAEVNVSDVGVFGSTHFKYRPCNITIYPGSEDNPDTFISVIAHEFCHIVLHSVKMPEKNTNDEERLTDLAVIFSGFSDIYKKGKKNRAGDTTIGYLSDDETSLACSLYSFELEEAKAFREELQKEYSDIMDKNSDKIRFINMVAKFLQNKNQKLNQEDVSKIGVCISAINKQQALQILNSTKEIKKLLQSKRYKSDRSSKDKIKLLRQTLNSVNMPDYEYIVILSKYI